MKHPIQNVMMDEKGIVRFVKNEIVRFLLDEGPFDMNTIALKGFSKEDQEQFAHLIGYSIGGFGDLNYVSDEAYNKADAKMRRLLKEREPK